MINVEICANSMASARAAKDGGAQRIELCASLECGGLTPSTEAIDYCVRVLSLRTHVLVRPREGDFCYSPSEVAEIEKSVAECRRLGAAAVVVGFLDCDRRIDIELTRHIVSLAAPMEVTFHRAFDEARQEPLEALRAVIDAGCHRLLTSGQKPDVVSGMPVIRQLVEHSCNLTILAGGGVTPDNARRLVEETGVTEVHGSCKTTLPDGTIQTDAAIVRKLLVTLNENR
jgi:copper homeostasis protein